jgi:hypothetical protein
MLLLIGLGHIATVEYLPYCAQNSAVNCLLCAAVPPTAPRDTSAETTAVAHLAPAPLLLLLTHVPYLLLLRLVVVVMVVGMPLGVVGTALQQQQICHQHHKLPARLPLALMAAAAAVAAAGAVESPLCAAAAAAAGLATAVAKGA